MFPIFPFFPCSILKLRHDFRREKKDTTLQVRKPAIWKTRTLARSGEAPGEFQAEARFGRAHVAGEDRAVAARGQRPHELAHARSVRLERRHLSSPTLSFSSTYLSRAWIYTWNLTFGPRLMCLLKKEPPKRNASEERSRAHRLRSEILRRRQKGSNLNTKSQQGLPNRNNCTLDAPANDQFLLLRSRPRQPPPLLRRA